MAGLTESEIVPAELIGPASTAQPMPKPAASSGQSPFAPSSDTRYPIPDSRYPTDPRTLVSRTINVIASAAEWCFGAATLIVALAVAASIPVVQLLSLGYLLEASGRIARTGKLRAGFVGVRKGARVGTLVVGTWMSLLPLRLLSTFWIAARVIEPGSPESRLLGFATLGLAAVLAAHVLGAWARGGRLRHFLVPWNGPWLLVHIFRRGAYTRARDAVWTFVAGLRLPYYFSLGLRGFVGGFAWLVLPITLLALGTIAPLAGLLGGVLLGLVVMYLPFLQTHFAAQNRLGAIFELGTIRRLFLRAPVAFWFAMLTTLLFAVPLYLLMVEAVEQEVLWLPSLFFVVFIFPARLLTGWAYARAARREQPRWFGVRWLARLAFVPVAAAYVLIVFASQYTNWHGVWGLYEQHAFLVPAPFLGL
ncbi:MAG: hypothetical protein HY000_02585 [Planctomycetes bacterium]|nr:hypothetical protein [Planctomycetota bacterium]